MRKIITILLMITVLSANAADRLFFISRSLNANVIVYDLELKDGKINTSNPVHAYWYNKGNNPVTTNELNFIQRKMAYGYNTVRANQNEAVIKLKAYNKREIHIRKHNGKWVAITTINGKECILTEIYAHCPTKTSCDYLEIKGKCISDGTSQKETVKA